MIYDRIPNVTTCEIKSLSSAQQTKFNAIYVAMSLDEITLTVTICDTCHTILVATKDKRVDFTDKEKAVINRIAELAGRVVRWSRRSIPDWAHVHLE